MERISLVFLVLAAMAVLTISVSPLTAAVKPNALFSSNAVLQRDMLVPIWGDARDGEKVTVEFREQKLSTTAKDGRWMVKLAPMTAGGPYIMTITGDDNKIELRNIMVGEVWLCGGQSNMEWPLKLASTGEKAIPGSADPMLRLFHTPRVALDNPVRDVNSSWTVSKPETTPDFSAVGYFFGRELRKALNIPIGLINANQGATMAEAWMPRDVLEADPDFKKVFEMQWPPEYQILRPTGLYNGMIAPIQGYAMRGVIWYQGESNAAQAYQYRRVFPAMMKVWRDKWGIDDLTFLTTQLAPFEFEDVGTEPRDSTWAELREAQLLTMQNDPNTGMAVITDAGDPKDIHPADKETVGIRLSLIARAKNYGEKIVYSGPIYDSMKVDGNKAIISFKHTGSGLLAKGGVLKGFAIAGEDKKFVWADAVIKGNKVVVSSPKVERPIAVRYGWANCPDVNLFNKENLPASPFRTDDFQMLTSPK